MDSGSIIIKLQPTIVTFTYQNGARTQQFTSPRLFSFQEDCLASSTHKLSTRLVGSLRSASPKHEEKNTSPSGSRLLRNHPPFDSCPHRLSFQLAKLLSEREWKPKHRVFNSKNNVNTDELIQKHLYSDPRISGGYQLQIWMLAHFEYALRKRFGLNF